MILHISAFIGAKNRHGGAKRSEQIVELLSSRDHITLMFGGNKRDCLSLAIKNPAIFFELLLFSIYMCLFYGLSIKGAVKFSLYSLHVCKYIKKNNYDLVILETAPGVSIPFMHYLAWKKIEYYALPHNIEHMVPGQEHVDFRSLSCLFKTELSGYLQAKSVYVISEFDKAILSCYGVSAKLLQYYPPEKDCSKFVEVSQARASSKAKSGYLLLGTVGNAPTLKGMREVIESYHGNDILYVGGYGTEVFGDLSTDKIRVLGALSEDHLLELMASVSALLINQPQTTGFLTKIIEFNVSGLPVFVTSEYFQVCGLNDYGIFRISPNQLDFFELECKNSNFKKFKKPRNFFVSEIR